MRPHYLITAFGIFVIATMICAIASGRWLVNGEINIFNAISSINAASVQAGGTWDVPKTVGGIGGFLDGIVTMLMWDYPFLDSPWALFIKIPLWCVSIGVIWGLIEVGTNAVQGIIGALRSLVGG